MSTSFKFHKSWADGFKPTIEAILVRYLGGDILHVSDAPWNLDVKRATDYVFTMSGGNDVACRIRHTYALHKFDDWTIRSDLRDGGETELHKLRSGYGKYYIYAYGDTPPSIIAFRLFDLDIVRRKGVLEKDRERVYNYTDNEREKRENGFVYIPYDEIRSCGAMIKEYPDRSVRRPDRFTLYDYEWK